MVLGVENWKEVYFKPEERFAHEHFKGDPISQTGFRILLTGLENIGQFTEWWKRHPIVYSTNYNASIIKINVDDTYLLIILSLFRWYGATEKIVLNRMNRKLTIWTGLDYADNKLSSRRLDQWMTLVVLMKFKLLWLNKKSQMNMICLYV